MTYDPSIFNVDSFERAQWVVLNPDGVHTPQERWKIETDYLMRFFEYYAPTKGARWLDYGVGAGRLAKPLIEHRDARVLGVDISPSMRQHAVNYVNSKNFLACSPQALDQLLQFGVRCDFAVAVWVLQHVEHLTEDLDRIGAVLVPGGRLLVLNMTTRCVPSKEQPWVNDGVNVWDILAVNFQPLRVEPVNENIISNTPAYFGVFERS